MLAILDYKAGNQTSVRRALESLGIPCRITDDAQAILQASGVIFPGVGAAGQAMAHLEASGLDHVLRQVVEKGIPLFGICLGCQILLESSEENLTKTLGIGQGTCVRFPSDMLDDQGDILPVPHMGWNQVKLVADCPLFEGVDPQAEFYFVHGYYPNPSPELVIGRTEYGIEFTSIYGRPGLWASQFHPEKSGRPGLKLLSNFAAYCQERANA